MGSNLDTLVNIGLDEKLPPDYRLAQQVCHAIANISDRRKARGVVTSKLGRVGVPLSTLDTHPRRCPQQPSVGERHPPFRLPQEHRLFERLREMVTKGELLCRAWGRRASLSVVAASPSSCAGSVHPDPLWVPFKEAAVGLIYQLAEGPEVICARILQDCAKQALEKLEKSDHQEAPRKWARGVVGPWQQPLTPPPPAATLTPSALPVPFCHSGCTVTATMPSTLMSCFFFSFLK